MLLLGPSGSGKSDLLLRLTQRGWHLVADDQVRLEARGEALWAAAPAALAGMLEARGLGLLTGLPHGPARLRLAVELRPRAEVPRLPEPDRFTALGLELPRLALHGLEASAPDKLALALAVLDQRLALRAGAFAA